VRRPASRDRLKSLSEDTHEDRVFRTDANALRDRLERYEAATREAAAGSNGVAHEPLSPELALVDAELARRAREELPDPVPEAARLSIVTAPPTVGEPLPRDIRPGFTVEARPPRRKRRLVGWMVAVTLLGAATGIAVSNTTTLRRFVSDHAPASIGAIGDPTPTPESPATAASPPTPNEQPESSGSSAPPPAVAPTTGTVASASPGAAPTPTPAAPRRTTPGGRTFAWVPVPGAASYLVQFYRGRKEIFSARPSKPRLALPGRWSYKGSEYSLAPGRYRWSVRPHFRGKKPLGPPIVRAKLVIRDSS
jgi:hypothetical protein